MNVSEDFGEVVKILKERHPNYKLYAVGLCNGAQIIGNYLARNTPIPGISYQLNFNGHSQLSESLLDGTVLLSPPPEMI